MKIANADILLVPGLHGSPTGHWQQRWLAKMPTAQWVEQEDWNRPDKDKWVETLKHHIVMATRPVILVGHSLGIATIVHTAQGLADTKVRGAFLVAPPSADENPTVDMDTKTFRDLPRDPLPFPSLVIGSTNDKYCTIERADDLASAWGSEFHNAGDVGHLGDEDGYGLWPEGMMMFARLMKRATE